MPLNSTYTTGGTDYIFGLTVINPIRETTAVANERLVTGSNLSIIDIVGKTKTKIKGKAFIDEIAADTLDEFDRIVGTSGVLVYAEGTFNVTLVNFDRTQVLVNSRHVADIEFWITS